MKKIAIIGAGYLQLPLVIEAKKLGLETHCFSWVEGAVCKNKADFFYPISIIEKEKIFEVCSKIGIDGICSIASDAAVKTVSYVATKLGLITNSYESAEMSTNKAFMRKQLENFGVKCPKNCIGFNEEIIVDMNFPLIVKPVDRSGSLGVLRVENFHDLMIAIEIAKNKSFSKQAIVEEFIVGNEVSVETISWKGKHHIITITDKVTTGSPHFVELEHHQPTQLEESIQTEINEQTIKALNALHINYGASHSEFKITETGEVYAIEIGARMGGDFIGSDLVYLSTGYNFVQAVINIALGEFCEPIIMNNKFSGVYFLSNQTEYLLPLIKGDENPTWLKRKEITNDILTNLQSSSDRSGYLIYQSDAKINIKSKL